jgi:hypothetical protein
MGDVIGEEKRGGRDGGGGRREERAGPGERGHRRGRGRGVRMRNIDRRMSWKQCPG